MHYWHQNLHGYHIGIDKICFYFYPLFYSIFSSNFYLNLNENPTFFSKCNDNCTATLLTKKQSSREHLCWCENEFSNKEKALSIAANDGWTIQPVYMLQPIPSLHAGSIIITVSRKCSTHNYIISQIPTHYSTTESTHLLF